MGCVHFLCTTVHFPVAPASHGWYITGKGDASCPGEAAVAITTRHGAKLAFKRAINKMAAILAEEPYFEPPTFRHQRDLAELATRYLDGRDLEIANARIDLHTAHYHVRMTFYAHRNAVEEYRPLTAGYADHRVPYVAAAARRVRESEQEHLDAKARMEAAQKALDALLAQVEAQREPVLASAQHKGARFVLRPTARVGTR